jgi:hypothetical protein
MSVQSTGRIYLLVAVCSGAAGCGSHLGPSALVPTSGEKVLYGASGGYSLYPSGSRGLAVAANGTIGFASPGESNRTQGWGSVQVGYGNRPVPDDSHLGIELALGPAAGDLVDSGRHAFAMGWTTDLSLLYRVSPTERPWQLGRHAETYHMLVPSIEVAQLVPVGAGHDHGLVTTFVFSLAYRFDGWLAVEP